MSKPRKFVFVLGAGASYGAGAVARVQAGGQIPIPTQSTFWPTLLRYCGTAARREIEPFLFRYFLNYARVPAALGPIRRAELLRRVDVEEVFTFLSERVRAPSTAPQARSAAQRVWEQLVESVGTVFSRYKANAATRAVYDRLRTNQFKSRDAVVSFNYDTIFETSLIKDVRWAYAGIEDCNGALPVLKPHGSINWAAGKNGRITRRTGPVPQPVVVAPTHLKFVSYASGPEESTAGRSGMVGYLDQSADIAKVWTEMERQMRAARALVFIGYSFPPADLYFSSVLRSVLAARGTDPDVVLVNPSANEIADRLKQRFAISQVVKYFDLQQYASVSRKDVIRLMERQ